MSIAINDQNFNEETNTGLVLVDFWATWCGPCRVQGPILEQLADEYDETELKVAKLDIDQNPFTPASFGIMSIPTLLLKKDGEVVEKLVGVQNKETLKRLVDQYK